MVSFLGRRCLVFYKSDDVFLKRSIISILGRGQVMHLLFWDKLEPFVTVINRNGRCKPKFILLFLVRSFYDQFSDRHCRSIRWLLPWITAFRCHFVMPLITTVQVPAILYVL